jgi:uncharacterized membrane protein
VQRLAALAILALAVVFRLFDLSARNLWTDEAWVALAVLEPTFAQVLAQGQSTPPLYLLTLWVLAKLCGGSEAVLRSLSFVFGVGAVALFWPWARRLASPGAALLGLAAVAASPVMVYFSKELKQYSADTFFATALFLLSERLLERPGGTRWWVLGMTGLLAIGYSHPAVFILPVVLVLLGAKLPNSRIPVAGLAILWGFAFAAVYFLVVRHQANPELVAYWAQDFPDFSGPLAFLIWLVGAVGRYLHFFLWKYGHIWGPALLLIGLGAFWRQRRFRSLVYFGGPLLLALAAAALHRYPFMAHFGGSRLMLFSAPALYLTVATGVMATLTVLWRRPWRPAAVVFACFLVLMLDPLTLIRENYRTTSNRAEIRPLVTILESHLKPRDRVYVYYHAIYPFKYYFRGNLDQVCWGKSCVEKDLSLSQPPRRLWLLAAHIPDIPYLEKFAGDLLGPEWRRTSLEIRPGALLYLFTRDGPDRSTNRKLPPGPDGCGSAVLPAGKV